jgi:hypothetical protein
MKCNWEAEIRRKTTLAVDRIQKAALQPSKGADVLKWWTLMATDVITHLSFGESFGMLEQGKVSPLYQIGIKSVSDVVNSKHHISMRCRRRC